MSLLPVDDLVLRHIHANLTWSMEIIGALKEQHPGGRARSKVWTLSGHCERNLAALLGNLCNADPKPLICGLAQVGATGSRGDA
jgi:hypothetical protein